VRAAEQVRAPGGPVQQRPSGEHRVRVTGGFQHVRQVGERVTGGAHHPHPHDRADLDQVPVADRHPVEGHLVCRVDVVGGADGQREGQAPGHVVVVQVGLEHMGDPDAPGRGQGQHPVGVPLRIHDQRDVPVVGEVTAVPQRGGVNGHHLHAGSCRGAHAALPFRPHRPDIPMGVYRVIYYKAAVALNANTPLGI